MVSAQYHNLSKIGPPLKISPPLLFSNEVVPKGAFLSKVCPPIHTVVHVVKQEVATVDQEIFTVKFFSPLGHAAKIKHTNISYVKKSYAKIFQSTVPKKQHCTRGARD